MSRQSELAELSRVYDNSALSNRNLVINGAMKVAQRGTSSTGVGATNGVYPTVDRFIFEAGNTAGRLTMTQESITDLNGFSKAIKLACTTADTSIAANEFLMLGHRFEGQDLQHLKKGTSDAEKVTVSFYVKGNANATYTLELRDNDNSRSNSQEFSVTTSWNRVVLTFDGDTSGSLDDDNALSLKCNIWLHGGSTYTGGTHTPNTWHGTTNQRVGDNQTSFFDSTSRTFFITGWQLEVGDTATPFEHRSYGDELTRCKRYFERLLVDQNSSSFVLGYGESATQVRAPFMYTTKRSNPSLAVSTAGNWEFVNGLESKTPSAITGSSLGKQFGILFGTISGGTTSRPYYPRANAGEYIDLDSEL